MSQPVKYVGFGIRMLAAMVDVFATLLLLPLFAFFDKIIGADLVRQQLDNARQNPELVNPQDLLEILMHLVPSMLFQLGVIGVLVVIAWMYFSATPGKMLFKIKIVDAVSGGEPSKKQYIIRFIGSIISLVVFGLGFLWIHYNKKHQGWHDLMAGTVVVDAKEKPQN